MSGKLIGGYKTRTAKKEYTCGVCCKPIAAGEKYVAYFCVDDEKHAWSEQEHVHCHNMMTEYCGQCPDNDGECWKSDCVTHAIMDSVCKTCEDRPWCWANASVCEKAWDGVKKIFG